MQSPKKCHGFIFSLAFIFTLCHVQADQALANSTPDSRAQVRRKEASNRRIKERRKARRKAKAIFKGLGFPKEYPRVTEFYSWYMKLLSEQPSVLVQWYVNVVEDLVRYIKTRENDPLERNFFILGERDLARSQIIFITERHTLYECLRDVELAKHQLIKDSDAVLTEGKAWNPNETFAGFGELEHQTFKLFFQKAQTGKDWEYHPQGFWQMREYLKQAVEFAAQSNDLIRAKAKGAADLLGQCNHRNTIHWGWDMSTQGKGIEWQDSRDSSMVQAIDYFLAQGRRVIVGTGAVHVPEYSAAISIALGNTHDAKIEIRSLEQFYAAESKLPNFSKVVFEYLKDKQYTVLIPKSLMRVTEKDYSGFELLLRRFERR